MPDSQPTNEESYRPGTDYSLRSSGRTYLDRNREAEKIIERIQRSSASVIGISGVRGAGKSSLAKKVLDQSSIAGYFTLLIPSPTGYEPREFLIAIFQRIAEEAEEQVRSIFEGLENLSVLGEQAAKKVWRQMFAIATVTFLFISIAGVGAYYWGFAQAHHARSEQIDTRITETEQQLELIDVAIAKRQSDPKSRPRSDEKVDPPLLGLSSFGLLAGQSAFDKFSPKVFSAQLENLDSERLREIRRRLQNVSQSLNRQKSIENKTTIRPPWVWAQEEMNSPDKSGIGLSIVAVFLFAMVGGIPAALFFAKLSRTYGKYRKFGKHVALWNKSNEFLELIKYQKVFASGTEVSLPVKYLTGKFSRSKQLTDRPLSLPGMTAVCTEFLQQVAEVFNGKVVICIDELDKITDVTQLLELLKGIKGILGQENTHFLLTISEDAMTYFTERLNRERSLVESSFEEIVYLDRLSYDLTASVVHQALAVNVIAPPHFAENCLVLWLFGGGVPREIKRNIIVCHNEGTPILQANPFGVWKVLYRAKLNSMLVLSAPAKASESHEHYRFLICIEQIIQMVDESQTDIDSVQFVESVLDAIRSNFRPLFEMLTFEIESRRTKDVSGKSVNPEEATDSTLYLAQLMEVIIGALTIVLVVPGKGKKIADFQKLDALIYVYKFIPINPQYAFYVLDKFLDTRLQELKITLDVLQKDQSSPLRPVGEMATG